MRPHVLLHRRCCVNYSRNLVPTESIRDLPGYELARQVGSCVAAVALRHKVKYQWVTRPPGKSPEVYWQAEFLVLDDPPVCYCTLYHIGEELGRRVAVLGPGVRAAIRHALYEAECVAMRQKWNHTMVEVEVETLTVMTYDWERWWWPVPCVLPASTTSASYPIEKQLHMEVYTDKKGGAEGCSICLDDFVPGTQVERLPCGHWFHGECLLPWLETVGSCPMCRHEFHIK